MINSFQYFYQISVTNEEERANSNENSSIENNDESSDEYEYYSDEDHYDMESSSETANEVINNQPNQQAIPRALNFLPHEPLISKRNHTSKM